MDSIDSAPGQIRMQLPKQTIMSNVKSHTASCLNSKPEPEPPLTTLNIQTAQDRERRGFPLPSKPRTKEDKPLRLTAITITEIQGHRAVHKLYDCIF